MIESVFRRTRVPVSVMSSAKLLSAVEPVIRYQRTRFRGGAPARRAHRAMSRGCSRKRMPCNGWWMSGQAARRGPPSALLRRACSIRSTRSSARRNGFLPSEGLAGARAQMKLFKELEKDALEYLALERQPEAERDAARFQELADDTLVQFLITDALTNVFCPACKLWNTGYGATMMREAVSLMGGYGITEDCPGFLGQKWMDAQLEATYEGPEAVQRRQLSITMMNELFLAQFRQWIKDMRGIAAGARGPEPAPWQAPWSSGSGPSITCRNPRTPTGNLSTIHRVTGWFFRSSMPSAGCSPHGSRSSICWSWKKKAPRIRWWPKVWPDSSISSATCATSRQPGPPARSAASAPSWSTATIATRTGAEMPRDLLPGRATGRLECIMPGIADYGRATGNAVEADGSHASKAGPCRQTSLQTFKVLRHRLDICLTGSRLAKDRAAMAVSKVMIPEALDYPA